MATDAKRGKIYTRHARLIEIAARGGGDPTSNTALRVAIDNAKAENVPNDNIDRAIKKGTGALKGEAMQEMIYEGYGPSGTAFVIECISDNKNRTLSNVRTILDKNGGRIAEGGSVLWLFDRKGVVVASGITGNHDELELELIDIGADDISWNENDVHITTNMSSWTKVRDFLKSKGSVDSAGLSYIPKNAISIDEETAQKADKLVEALEEDDDVSEVHSNVH